MTRTQIAGSKRSGKTHRMPSTRPTGLEEAEVMTEKDNTKTDLRKAIDDWCDEHWPDDEILLFGGEDGDPYDEGFIGVGWRINQVPVAIYDREACINALAEEFAEDTDTYKDDGDEDPYTDAVEFWDFNTEGSWVGEQTPIIISRFSHDST